MCGNCAAIGRRRAGSSGATGTDLNGALIGPLGHADSHVTRQQQRAPNTRTNNRKRATPNAVLPPSTFYGSLTRHYRFCFVLFCFYVGKDDKKLKRSEKERPSPSFHQVSSNLVSMGFGNESNLILLFGFRFMVVFLSEFQRANRELFFFNGLACCGFISLQNRFWWINRNSATWKWVFSKGLRGISSILFTRVVSFLCGFERVLLRTAGRLLAASSEFSFPGRQEGGLGPGISGQFLFSLPLTVIQPSLRRGRRCSCVCVFVCACVRACVCVCVCVCAPHTHRQTYWDVPQGSNFVWTPLKYPTRTRFTSSRRSAQLHISLSLSLSLFSRSLLAFCFAFSSSSFSSSFPPSSSSSLFFRFPNSAKKKITDILRPKWKVSAFYSLFFVSTLFSFFVLHLKNLLRFYLDYLIPKQFLKYRCVQRCSSLVLA